MFEVPLMSCAQFLFLFGGTFIEGAVVGGCP